MPSGSGYFKTKYGDDMAILDTPFRWFWFAVLIVGLVALPFVTSSYMLHLINLGMLASLAALSLNLLTGYTGLLSLGHAGFLCAGAFTGAILGARWGMPIWLVVPLAGVVGAFLGLITGLPALRLRTVYVLLTTLAMHFTIVFGAAVYQVFGAGFASSITMPSASFGSWVVDSPQKWYILLAILTGLVTIFCINLVRSRVGRAWMAVRDHDVAALILGVDVGYYKLLAFVVSTALASVTGALSAYYMHYASYDTYTLWVGVTYVAMIAIGGLGSIMGSFLGALFVTFLTPGLSAAFEMLAVPQQIEMAFPAIQLGLYGLLIMLFVLIEPLGLVGIWLRVRTFFELWPFKYKRVITTTR